MSKLTTPFGLAAAAVAVGAVLGSVVLADDTVQAAAAGGSCQVDALLGRVDALESRVDELEQRLRQLDLPPVPDDWVPDEFNGMRYYLVPCAETEPEVAEQPALR